MKRLVEAKGSDLHLVPGYKPRGRVNGELIEWDDLVLTPEQTHWVGTGLFERDTRYGGPQRRTLELGGGKLGDARNSSVGGKTVITVRVHGGPIPNLTQIEAPEPVTQILSASHGIFIVAGPHGSGKTTTLYALTDWINRNRNVHICTVESPRWHLFEPAKALVQQHEVGIDGESVSSIVRDVLLKAPEVLMIGEVEDIDTLATCVRAAETGHLVILHLNARDPADAVQRLISCAPEDMQPEIRERLKDLLRGVMVQRLAVNTKGGRTPVYELVGEGAKRLVDGRTLERGSYLARAADRLEALKADGTLSADEAERLAQEFGG